MIHLFPRGIPEDRSYTIKVNRQFKLELLHLQLICVDTIALPMLAISKSPILEIGLILSYLYDNENMCTNGCCNKKFLKCPLYLDYILITKNLKIMISKGKSKVLESVK
jgi:hypothetical protein